MAIGVEVGLGLPIVAAAAFAYYWRFVRPGMVGSSRIGGGVGDLMLCSVSSCAETRAAVPSPLILMLPVVSINKETSTTTSFVNGLPALVSGRATRTGRQGRGGGMRNRDWHAAEAQCAAAHPQPHVVLTRSQRGKDHGMGMGVRWQVAEDRTGQA